MTVVLVMMPTQLYELKYLPRDIDHIILWEHPHYFKAYQYNVKKLVLHRASMQYYYKYIKKKYKCQYISFNEKLPLKDYSIFDPTDSIDLPGKPTMLESPNFLLSMEHLRLYREKTSKFFFNAFYMWGKKKINVLPTIKSQDKLNRKRMPRAIKVPSISSNKPDHEFIQEATLYVQKHFPNNPGNLDNFVYPITHKTAKKFLKHFINTKLDNFGNYQDFIDPTEPFMFHSILSSSLNCGLLQPRTVMDAVVAQKNPLNSIEGFVRQLFWREYQRYCYLYCSFKGNYFQNKKKLTKHWYNGTLGIEPVDHCIVKAFDTGYLHHIERLMIVGNFMMLSQIHPQQGYRWFMEFAIDSYEWVMHQNVLDMVFFVTGGKTTRRPYVSSSNYVIRMSTYRPGEWSDKWNALYRKFIDRHRKRLYKFRYYFKL